MTGKTGAARVALTTGCPLVPVAQWGAQELLAPYAQRLRLLPRKTMHVWAGPPVDLADLQRPPADARVLARRPTGSWRRSRPCWSRSAASRRRRSASTRASPAPAPATAAGQDRPAPPTARARGGTHDARRRARLRQLGHGVRHRARRRRERREHVGPARRAGRARSTTSTCNADYLPEHRAAATIIGATTDPAEAARAAPRSSCWRCRRSRCARTWRLVGRCCRRDAVVVSLMKGVELGTTRRMSEVIAEAGGVGRGAGRGRLRARTWPARSPRASRRPASWPAPTRRRPSCVADACAHAVLPSVHQHRRRRHRARRRGQERHRARRRHGRGHGPGRQHQGHRSSPAGWPRPPGSGSRSARTRDVRRPGRRRRPHRDLHVAAVAQPHLRR